MKPTPEQRDRELKAAQELAEAVLNIKQQQAQAELGLAYNAQFICEVWRLWIESGKDPFILELAKTPNGLMFARMWMAYRRLKHDNPGSDTD